MADINMKKMADESVVLFSSDDLDNNKKEKEIIISDHPEKDIDSTDVLFDENNKISEYQEPTEEPEAEQERPAEPKEEHIPRKKNKKRASERVKQVLYEKKAYQNAAYSLLDENKSLKHQLEKTSKLANSYYEDSLKIRSDLADKLYREAIEEGDSEKQAKAHRALIEFETEKKRPRQNFVYDYEADVGDYVGNVEEPSAYEEFLLENDWADQNGHSFDPDKHRIASEFENEVLLHMKRAGASQREITLSMNTKDYWDAISDYVEEQMGGGYGYKGGNSNYNTDEEDYPEPDKAPRIPQKVAPVNRTNTAQSYTNTPPKSSTRVHLSQDDIEFALKIDYGIILSDEEKIARFAKSRRARLQSENN